MGGPAVDSRTAREVGPPCYPGVGDLADHLCDPVVLRLVLFVVGDLAAVADDELVVAGPAAEPCRRRHDPIGAGAACATAPATVLELGAPLPRRQLAHQ